MNRPTWSSTPKVRPARWLYRPDGGGVVPASGQVTGFAFAQAGLAALVFDNRNFGASDGEPRYEIDPWAQVRDYRHAITHLQTLPGIDRDRIGVWGSSYSGGHASCSGHRQADQDRGVPGPAHQRVQERAAAGAERLPSRPGAGLDADREARFAGKEPGMIPVVAEDPLAPSALPTPDSWQWFTDTGRTRAPSWSNEVTLRTLEMLMEYDPGSYIDRISPTPLLMVVAAGDVLTPSDLAFEAYEHALEPKRLVVLPGGHFGAYTGPDFDLSSGKPGIGWCGI